MKTKKCSNCGSTKPLGDYCIDRTCKNGVRSYCKRCESAKTKERYRRNKEKGICVKCGKEPALASITHCKMCWVKLAASNTMGSRGGSIPADLLALLEAQDYKCALTGIQLVPALTPPWII